MSFLQFSTPQQMRAQEIPVFMYPSPPQTRSFPGCLFPLPALFCRKVAELVAAACCGLRCGEEPGPHLPCPAPTGSRDPPPPSWQGCRAVSSGCSPGG